MASTMRFDTWENPTATKSVTMDQIAGGSALVPIVPTSATVGSGTYSISTSGVVTFAGATSVSIDGAFSSAYNRYKVVINANIVTTERWLELRLRSGGSNITTNNYAYTVRRFENSGTAATDNSAQSSALFSIAGPTVGGQTFAFDINNAFTPTVTNWFGQSETVFSAGTFNMAVFGGMFTGTTSMTGFSITPQAENITGTIQVYGYR